MSVPDRIRDIRIDQVANRACVGWSSTGVWGCRIVDLFTGIQWDISTSGSSIDDLRLELAHDGVAVGCSGFVEYDDYEEANKFRVRGLAAFDTTTGELLWRKDVGDQPALALKAGCLTIDREGLLWLNAHPEWPNETVDLLTGEPLSDAVVAERTASNPPAVRVNSEFPEIGGTLERDELFEHWSQRLQHHVGVRPIQRMNVLAHNGVDIVNFHASQESGYGERFVVMRGHSVLKHYRLGGTNATTTDAFTSDWNLTGFSILESSLVLTTGHNEVKFLPL